MFKENPNKGQISVNDPMLRFPKYLREALKKTWAYNFYWNIFKNINESRFSVLFSEKYSRPNAPVNILVGLLILKEINGWTDEEMMGALYFDYRVQYALGITDFEYERICINTVGNFRGRLYEYSGTLGVDLLEEEVKALTGVLIALTGMDTSLARQDSFMISANCKKMGRLELIYTTNVNMVKQLTKVSDALVPESCRHYFQEGDKADHVYRLKKDEVSGKLKQLLEESLVLYEAVPDNLVETQDYLNLTRLLSEQAILTETGVVPKENSEISANSMQNPSEPDATYRKKGDKKYTGYVVNAVEARDTEKDLSVIIHHEQQPNTTSDVELGMNTLDAELDGVEAIANDGAFYSADTVEKAEERHIEMGFSAMTGKKAKDGQLGVNEFSIDENGHISACPAGYSPLSAEYKADKEAYTAKFLKEHCADCPLFDICPVEEQKKANKVSFTKKTLQADICRAKMGEARFQELAAFRAGVEGVPSVLRRRYDIDAIPVRGLKRSRIWVNCKIMAYNFISFFEYCKRNAKKGEAFASLSHILRYYFLRPLLGASNSTRMQINGLLI